MTSNLLILFFICTFRDLLLGQLCIEKKNMYLPNLVLHIGIATLTYRELNDILIRSHACMTMIFVNDRS